ncbi:hypothetical protein C8R42DRAFT_729453 [Lentinula raphanica]|nr:hypothetical protein C8R42DRAFT_729453 [Lentinula raphanica]
MAVDLVPHIHPRAASTSPGIFINEQTSKIMNPGIHNIQLSKGPHAHPRSLIPNQSLTTLLAILEALSTLTPATTSMSSVVTVISLSSSPSPSSPSLPSQGLEIIRSIHEKQPIEVRKKTDVKIEIVQRYLPLKRGLWNDNGKFARSLGS